MNSQLFRIITALFCVFALHGCIIMDAPSTKALILNNTLSRFRLETCDANYSFHGHSEKYIALSELGNSFSIVFNDKKCSYSPLRWPSNLHRMKIMNLQVEPNGNIYIANGKNKNMPVPIDDTMLIAQPISTIPTL